ncbi:radical SAM family heme chaperone HemW [Mucilaginibacter myungsuensis]|uniref:Heme chaperone HemW n=1 Tax=Mucilaginibacter myungsuensis TaxID=649104 RepID=A0A929L0F4_9SPHI|nr:radical SAM family heme chaperone HemW [Mucilaginibacter myungsuensis]MBE9663955.1 radical SAM family heme chaperone HemW [Mucilaginibacter myungsuensis]MDN3598329.1 radical SAM family heme chaperone HemW [Mucilaginibacter myungsuensis]
MAGIYIHIPFCKQACHYCDFHFSTSLKYRDEMVGSIAKEITLQKDYLGGETINTIYFGGGTPSLLNADEINRIINTITGLHTVASDAEITLEANPDDLHAAAVKSLRRTPVTRFSIGIQSFFDEDLLWMNRAHHAAEAEASVKRAQDAGFENITADLIYGYPMLTDVKWKHNMDTLFGLDIPHVSAYSLTVEPRTALATFVKNKKTPPLSDQQSAGQFLMLMEQMEKRGFEHYEISNFAKPGQYSRHNTNYWKGVKYLGVGPSAHSFNGDTRQWNVANNAKYLAALADNKLPFEVEELTEENRLNEYIMTSLRTQWGLDLSKLEQIAAGTKTILQKEARPFFTKDWLKQDNDTLTLTLSGKLYADHIAGELFF